MTDATRVVALEEKKMTLDPADPKVDQLSSQIERIAGGIEDKAKAEQGLSAEITGDD